MTYTIHHQNNLDILDSLDKGSINLIYIDPPFNTGKKQKIHDRSYEDKYENYIEFLEPRLREVHRVLKDDGSIFVHLDYREVHYIKVLMDKIFGRNNFQNEIIWSYDYGGRPKNKWACKHDTILWYTKHSTNYTFNYDAIDRIPYMAPKLVGEEKAEKGKTPTDVWWNTIVHTSVKDRYPTQKPLSILERIVMVHSNENDLCLDFFAGSGSFGEACLKNSRNVILVDKSEDACKVMQNKLSKYDICSIQDFDDI